MSDTVKIESNPQGNLPLTHEEAFKLAGALARLEELKNSPPELAIIKGDGSEAPANAEKLTRDSEIVALVEYVSQGLLAHASEFLGCYFAIQTEYTPLCRALAPVVARINATRAAQVAKAVQQPVQVAPASN